MRDRLTLFRRVLRLLPPSARKLGDAVHSDLLGRAVDGRLHARSIVYETASLLGLVLDEWRYVVARHWLIPFDRAMGALRWVIVHTRRDWTSRLVPAVTITLALAMASWNAGLSGGRLRNPLGDANPDGLSWVWSLQPDEWNSIGGVSASELDKLVRQREVVAVAGVKESPVHVRTSHFSGLKPALEVIGDPVAVLATEWAFGRAPISRAGIQEAAVTWLFWQQAFGGEPRAVGSVFGVNGDSVLLVGVLPSATPMPLPHLPNADWPQLMLPVSGPDRSDNSFLGLVRRSPGVPQRGLTRTLDAFALRLHEDDRDTYPSGWALGSRDVSKPLVLTQGPLRRLRLGALLLFCFAVLAGTQTRLGRLRSTQAEHIVATLGASSRARALERWTYVLAVGVTIGGTAILLALAGFGAIQRIWINRWPELADIQPNIPVAIAVGVFGAMIVSIALVRAFGSPTHDRWRALTICRPTWLNNGPAKQLALLGGSCVVILGLSADAAARYHSQHHARDGAPGMTVATIVLPDGSVGESALSASVVRKHVSEQLAGRVVALSDVRMFHPGRWSTVHVVTGAARSTSGSISAIVSQITPTFVDAIGARTVVGRDLSAGTDALVDSTFAAEVWGIRSAVGQRVSVSLPGADQRVYRIVGVISGPAPPPALRRAPMAHLFVPIGSWSVTELNVYVNDAGAVAPTELAKALESAGFASTHVETLKDIWTLRGTAVQETTVLFAFQGVVALVVAMLFLLTGVREAYVERRRVLALQVALGLPPSRLKIRLVMALLMPGFVAGGMIVVVTWIVWVFRGHNVLPSQTAPLIAGLLLYVTAGLTGALVGLKPLAPFNVAAALRHER